MSAPDLGITARARIERVVDGDTVDLVLLTPFRVRLLDCWAPETSKPEGKAAKLHLEKLLPKGTIVKTHIPTGEARGVRDVFSFGRVLGHVWTETEESVGELMVEDGFADAEPKK